MKTKLEALDELIALASNAGMCSSEAIIANTQAYAKRDRRLTLGLTTNEDYVRARVELARRTQAQS